MSTNPHPLYPEAADPLVAQARLAEIAAAHPELHPVIAANPACYPGLLEWMRQAGTLQPSAPQYQQPVAQPQGQGGSGGTGGTGAPVQPDPFGRSAALGQLAGAPGVTRVSGRRPRNRVLLWGSIAVVMLLLGGGGAWAYVGFFSKLGGASSPQAAVQKLLEAAADIDPVGVYGSLSPAEVSALKAPVESLAQLQLDDAAGDQVDVQHIIDGVIQSLTSTVSDLEFQVDEVTEGIAAVTITAGEYSLDGDPDVLAAAYIDGVRGQTLASYDSWGYSASEAEEFLADTESSVRDGLAEQLPYRLTVADLRDSLGDDPVVMAVQEGGSWYVSPLLTWGELATRNGSGGSTPGSVRVAEPAAFATADEAAQGLADGVSRYLKRGDTEALAAALPLAERRFVSLYGDYLAGNLESGTGIEVTELELDTEVIGDTARIDIVRASLVGDGYAYPYYIDIDGICATGQGDYSSFDGCLDDVPALDELGAADFSVLAVKEGDGWFVSPLRTIGDAGATAVENLVRLSEADALDRLYR